MSKKWRGKQRWKHHGDLNCRLLAAEVALDQAQQILSSRLKPLVFGENLSLPMEVYSGSLNAVGKALGHVRSALAIMKHQQKTLRRYLREPT
mgnify:CR=1 FL=1